MESPRRRSQHFAGHWGSRHLSLEDFMTTTANANTTQVSNPQFTFPAFLLAEMDVMIDKLTYRKIILADFNARVNVNEKSLNIKNAEMAAFGGNLNLTGTISTLPKNRLRSEFIGSCKEIEVSQLFYALEDFGQEVVTHKNIKGTLTSKTNFSLDWNPDLTPDLKTAVATSDFFIDNGRLSDLEPMKKLGKFTEVSGLNNLTFSRMSNQIYIHDEKIFIPKMDIKSSAMDMTVAGTHTFDNIMDFHITMNVSQLVFGKNRKTEDEFGAIEVNDRGGVNLFIKMSGPVSDPKISYDGKVARKLLGNSIKEEAKQFNNLLNGENIVGPDGKKRNDLNKVQDDYQINWGDEETTNTQTQNSSDNEENTVNQAQQNRAKAWEKFKGKISTNKK
ncbi:MAG: hypothetical protein EOP53_04980 [Sphingobacteriales bacterium]|nr:MAG: hypothetical protein EOP53_04980 [Sphingobacteriales bacterium]